MPTAAVWAVLLPLLVTAVLQPATGLLADMLGRKRIWMLGYAINLAGTTLAGCSSSLGMLLAGRLIQGLGSSLDSPTGIAMILEAFGKEDRAMVLGAYTASNTVGASVGLIAGGVIVQHFGWRMLFLWPIARCVPPAGVCVLRAPVRPPRLQRSRGTCGLRKHAAPRATRVI